MSAVPRATIAAISGPGAQQSLRRPRVGVAIWHTWTLWLVGPSPPPRLARSSNPWLERLAVIDISSSSEGYEAVRRACLGLARCVLKSRLKAAKIVNAERLGSEYRNDNQVSRMNR
jgi:hypothetical protein